MADLSSLQAHIDAINEHNAAAGCPFALAGAEHFNRHYGIETVDQFNEHMDRETWSDLHKEFYGFRPRYDASIEQVRADLDRWAAQED